jgi:hypothetical protein
LPRNDIKLNWIRLRCNLYNQINQKAYYVALEREKKGRLESEAKRAKQRAKALDRARKKRQGARTTQRADQGSL